MRRDEDLQKASTLIVVDTLELEVIAQARLTVEPRRITRLRVEERGMLVLRFLRSRYKQTQALKTVIGREG